eukprot:TRINITY_DN124565_c0_g1_i1.p1 TRINITY_DN124565_c0_g1~~TRINITY_DN124565_c0_g1_i1.p1  ORF type:complete len:531 (-),score=116.34 TRINITY_DN124565_c0_g1_i1:23-1540(-)
MMLARSAAESNGRPPSVGSTTRPPTMRMAGASLVGSSGRPGTSGCGRPGTSGGVGAPVDAACLLAGLTPQAAAASPPTRTDGQAVGRPLSRAGSLLNVASGLAPPGSAATPSSCSRSSGRLPTDGVRSSTPSCGVRAASGDLLQQQQQALPPLLRSGQLFLRCCGMDAATAAASASPGGQSQLRRVASLPIYGVAAALSAADFRRLISQAAIPSKKALWIDARSQPLLFVNGRSCYLEERAANALQAALRARASQSGCSLTFQDVERVLKQEVLEEAALRGQVELHTPGGDVVGEPVHEVLTPEELYADLQKELPGWRFVDLSLAEEAVSSMQVFDEILGSLSPLDAADCSIACHCRSGQERTLVTLAAILALVLPHLERGSSLSEESIKPVARTAPDPAVVVALVDKLKNGEAMRIWVDHNLAKCVAGLVAVAAVDATNADRAGCDLLAHCWNLQGYMALLLFSCYLQEQALRTVASFSTSFRHWLKATHAETGVCEMLQRQQS